MHGLNVRLNFATTFACGAAVSFGLNDTLPLWTGHIAPPTAGTGGARAADRAATRTKNAHSDNSATKRPPKRDRIVGLTPHEHRAVGIHAECGHCTERTVQSVEQILAI